MRRFKRLTEKERQKLMRAREVRGLNLEQLAKLLGVNKSTVGRWEDGSGGISPLALEKVREKLPEAGL